MNFYFITYQIIFSRTLYFYVVFTLEGKLEFIIFIEHHHFLDSRLYFTVALVGFLTWVIQDNGINPGLVFKSALPGNSQSWFYNLSGICYLIFQPNFVSFSCSFWPSNYGRLIKIHTSFTPSTKVKFKSNVCTSQLALWCLFEYV